MFAAKQRVEIVVPGGNNVGRPAVVVQQADGKVIVREEDGYIREYYIQHLRASQCMRCSDTLTEYNCTQIQEVCDGCLVHMGGLS